MKMHYTVKHYDKACVVTNASIFSSLNVTQAMITYHWTIIAHRESLQQLIVQVCTGEYR